MTNRIYETIKVDGDHVEQVENLVVGDHGLYSAVHRYMERVAGLNMHPNMVARNPVGDMLAVVLPAGKLFIFKQVIITREDSNTR